MVGWVVWWMNSSSSSSSSSLLSCLSFSTSSSEDMQIASIFRRGARCLGGCGGGGVQGLRRRRLKGLGRGQSSSSLSSELGDDLSSACSLCAASFPLSSLSSICSSFGFRLGLRTRDTSGEDDCGSTTSWPSLADDEAAENLGARANCWEDDGAGC